MASGVLRDVTNLKIARLADQQSQFEQAKAALLERAQDRSDSVAILSSGLQELGLDGASTDASLRNIDLLFEQSKHDASIPSSLLLRFGSELKASLDAKSMRFQYAQLFAKLATEWADNPNDVNALLQANNTAEESTSRPGSPTDSEQFEALGREEMHRQRQVWDSHVFSEKTTDPVAIEQYLLELFSKTTKTKRSGKTPLEALRQNMQSFGVDVHGRPALRRCNENDIRVCVKGLLKADLFTGKKRAALQDLSSARPAVLKEVADVINMELPALGSWQWQPSPIPAHTRRQLNGKYRVYMDPDLHQALLVHWVGAQFAVYLKKAFTSFFLSGAWTQSQQVFMGKQDKIRRKYYLEKTGLARANAGSVRNERRQTFMDDFFMIQLPSSIAEGNREYGDSEDDSCEGKSPLEIKQSLLHIATVEMLLQRKLYGKFTAVQTDFKWFGPSLPHSTIFAVLRFFHVPKYWIDFFQKFLSMSLIFPDDGPNAEARTRKCGIPISHALSDALGEAVLFCLDFAVNKNTHGRIQLYRFHDDVWFWGQEDSCLKAWKAVIAFTKVMGMGINEEKTGSFSLDDALPKKSKSVTGLPNGPVRWGFLTFNPSEGRWIIDMKSINEHISELRTQLMACRSVLSWIEAWNSYVSRFFSNNFGKATNCMGRQHLDMVFSTFKHIQKELFTSLEDGSCRDVSSYLKKIISQKFDIDDISDAFLAFPIENGGLDVRNPFIPLLAIYNQSAQDPSARIQQAFDEEEEAYETLKEIFEAGDHEDSTDVPEGCDSKKFFSFEEYVRFREETSAPLLRAYNHLLAMPAVRGLELTNTVAVALKELPADLRVSGHLNARFEAMDTYWQWVLQLYAKEAVSRFGGLVLGEQEVLPIELVKLLRSEKVRWQG